MRSDKGTRFWDAITELPKIEIPLVQPPTPDEIEFRRAHFVKVMKLRQRMPPLGISSDDLIHLSRSIDR